MESANLSVHSPAYEKLKRFFCRVCLFSEKAVRRDSPAFCLTDKNKA